MLAILNVIFDQLYKIPTGKLLKTNVRISTILTFVLSSFPVGFLFQLTVY